MTPYEKIMETYPDLTDEDFKPMTGTISLYDDGDGVQYIKSWNYSKPLPAGLKIGK
jgi:hypothetical protein